jgi:hypothetical protein
MQDKNINIKTAVKFVFPIFGNNIEMVEKQLTIITCNLIQMKSLLNEPCKEMLIKYNQKLESINNFDFYNYQKQNMDTNYYFFTSSNAKLCGYNSRKLFVKSKNDSIHQQRINLAKNVYNIIVRDLVNYKVNDSEPIAKQFENWYEGNSIKFQNDSPPLFIEADYDELLIKVFENINKMDSNQSMKEAA